MGGDIVEKRHLHYKFLIYAHIFTFREREKAELRDRKVLEILQKKDERIEELQSNLAYNTRELGESAIRWVMLCSETSVLLLTKAIFMSRIPYVYARYNVLNWNFQEF